MRVRWQEVATVEVVSQEGEIIMCNIVVLSIVISTAEVRKPIAHGALHYVSIPSFLAWRARWGNSCRASAKLCPTIRQYTWSSYNRTYIRDILLPSIGVNVALVTVATTQLVS